MDSWQRVKFNSVEKIYHCSNTNMPTHSQVESSWVEPVMRVLLSVVAVVVHLQHWALSRLSHLVSPQWKRREVIIAYTARRRWCKLICKSLSTPTHHFQFIPIRWRNCLCERIVLMRSSLPIRLTTINFRVAASHRALVVEKFSTLSSLPPPQYRRTEPHHHLDYLYYKRR